ncbi:family 16 glycosylhydrolase [Paenibacillus sp. strain BS8-2]
MNVQASNSKQGRQRLKVWMIYGLCMLLMLGSWNVVAVSTVQAEEAMPDLVITDIMLDKPAYKVGDKVKFLVTVHNEGNADAGAWFGVNVRLKTGETYDESQFLDWTGVNSLAAGQSITVATNDGWLITEQLWEETGGTFELWAMADESFGSRVITESDESNNDLMKSFSPAPSLPDLVITDIALDKPNYEVNDRVKFIITVKNQGEADATNWFGINVKLRNQSNFDNSQYLDWASVDSLAAGETIVVTTGDGWVVDRENFEVWAMADNSNGYKAVDESDENNNVYGVPFAKVSQPVGPDSGWTLTFMDEFNGSSLDETKWNYHWPWGTTAEHSDEVLREQNIEVSDGALTIKADVEDSQWYSGLIQTNGKFSQQYGYWEARMKAAPGDGFLTAFWAKTEEMWPPEIDFMEVLGNDPDDVHMTQHYRNGSGTHVPDGGSWNSPSDLTEEYHVYGAEWTDTQIKWYVDGKLRRTTANNVGKALYAVLNVHVGNDWTGDPALEDTETKTAQVDWVRVWKRSQAPDLTVDKVDITKSDYTIGDAVQFQVRVKNTGASRVNEQVEMTFTHVGETIPFLSETVSLDLGPGQSVNLTSGSWIVDREIVHVRFEVDATSVVMESDEENNKLQRAIMPLSGELVFYEEFLGDGVYRNDWNLAEGWSSGAEATYYDPSMTAVEDGKVVLTDSLLAETPLSGMIHTAGKVSMLYGRVEIKAKLLPAEGHASSISLMPNKGNSGGVPQVNAPRIAFIQQDDVLSASYKQLDSDADVNQLEQGEGENSFHIYELDWNPNGLSWRVDGEVVHTYTDQLHIAADPMALFLDGAMEIDYVKIYGFNLGDVPSSPRLRASDKTANSVTLSWRQLSERADIESYEIYQDGSLIRTVDNDQMELIVSNLQPEQRYQFVVRAIGEDYNSPPSNVIEVKTDAVTPRNTSWELVWSDDFDGDTVDTEKWNIVDAPSNVNQELQYFAPDDVYVEDGSLVLRTQSRNYGGRSFTSGGVNTKDKMTLTEGKVEIRAKLPEGQGLRASHFLLNNVCSGVDPCIGGWPPEMDVTDVLGHLTDQNKMTYHYGAWPNNGETGYTLVGEDFSEDYHVFAVDWDGDGIRFYVDDILWHEANHAEWMTDIPMMLLLNTSVGGVASGVPDGSTLLPQYHYIDYVKVYEKGEDTPVILPTDTPNMPAEQPQAILEQGAIKVKPVLRGGEWLAIVQEKLISDLAQLIAGAPTLPIKLESATDSKTVRLQLPMQAIQSIQDHGIPYLTIQHPNGNVRLSVEWLMEQGHAEGQLEFSISGSSAEYKSADTVTTLSTEPKLDVTLSLGGVKPEDIRYGAVTITMPATKSGFNGEMAIFYAVNQDGGMEPIKHSWYDAASKEISFYPQRLGAFELGDASRNAYHDVANTGWAADSIYSLSGRGILQGTGQGKFDPDKALSRAEFAAMLAYSFDFVALQAETSAFKDVSSGSWYYDAVTAATQMGLLHGFEDGSFRPDQAVTRQEMAVMAARALRAAGLQLQSEELPFSDSLLIASYAIDSISALYREGVLKGMDDGTFQPEHHATRAQAAVIVDRLLRLGYSKDIHG